ncbi:MAG: FAD-dependent oxidoreductase, partial [archaeon]
MTEHTDVAVIGSGPAGYVAAIRAGQLGKMVTLIEKEPAGLGGLCLHHGCIPSKALIHTANVFWDCTHSKEMGINVSMATLDMQKTQEFKRGVVEQLTKGIEGLLSKAGVDVVYGKATFVKSNTLHIVQEHDTMGLTADRIIIATGGKEMELPALPF